jgi:hypothetical protein
MKRSFNPRKVTAAVALLLVSAGTISCLYPPSGIYFNWWEAHAFEWMLFLLAAGLLFFISNRSLLMYICFAGCAVVCYTLQERTVEDLRPASHSEDAFNLRLGAFRSPGEGALLDSTLRTIIETGTDIVAIRNITPATIPYIHDYLRRHGYRFSHLEPDNRHPLSMAIYARPAMEFLGPSTHCEAPHIFGRLNLSTRGASRELHLFYASLCPDGKSNPHPVDQLDQIGRQIGKSKVPVIAIGNFDLVPWSYKLQHFKKISALHDSRRGVQPASRQGHLTLFENPIDYIFYSNHFKCISFEMISSGGDAQIGVVGTYQFTTKARSANVAQTSQEL